MRNHAFGGHRVMDVLRVRRRPLGHTDRSTWIEEVRLPTKMTRLERRIGAFGEPVIQGQDVELGGLRHEAILKVAKLLRLLGGEIVRLREVLLDVVEFPAVLVERYAAGGYSGPPALGAT